MTAPAPAPAPAADPQQEARRLADVAARATADLATEADEALTRARRRHSAAPPDERETALEPYRLAALRANRDHREAAARAARLGGTRQPTSAAGGPSP